MKPKHDLRLKQRRVWINSYTREAMLDCVENVTWIGNTGAVLATDDGREEFFRFDTIMEETIALGKARKGLKNEQR